MRRAHSGVKSAHTGLTRKIGLALAVAVMLTLAVASVGLAREAAPTGVDFPGLGQYFYGTASSCGDLKLLPPGSIVTAKAVTGNWKGTASSAVNASGLYGKDTPLLVPKDTSNGSAGDGAWPGDQIAFYVYGVQAKLVDVATGQTLDTFPYYSGDPTLIEHLDLIVCLPQLTITPTAGTGGTITPSTPQTVNFGGSATFTIAPNVGYRILDVKVDGVSNAGAVAAGSYTFTNVTANHTIEATFEILKYTITVTAGANGTITPGTKTVNYGDSPTFTITPNTGYKIVDVKVDGVSNAGAVAAGSYTFTNVTADHTIAATFEILRFTITPTAGANGTISPSTPQTVDYGGSATFTITPNTGYRILDVKVDGVSNAGAVAAHSYTFTNVTADHSIAATFKATLRVFLPVVLR
jgi:hypothetical protein